MKLLLAINSLSVGGIQTALLNLLNELSRDGRYDITLLLVRDKGLLRDRVPANVRVVCANRLWGLLEYSNEEIKQQSKWLWLVRGAMALLIKRGGRGFVTRCLALTQRSLGRYDVAVSFRHPDLSTNVLGGSVELVLDCCRAKRRVCFVHCDWDNYGGNTPYNRALIGRYDGIAAVSRSCMDRFCGCVPGAADRCAVVPNCFDYPRLRAMAAENTVRYAHTCSTFVSVCRLGAEKGLHRTVEVLRRLRDEGLDFRWHIVGDGEERSRLAHRIAQAGLADHIRLEGETDNPYRYMADADFLLIPSYHEAAPMVIQEAYALGLPVVTTRTLSADEMIAAGAGCVMDNTDEGIYAGLRELLLHPERLAGMRDSLCRMGFNNTAALDAFTRYVIAMGKDERGDD